MNIVLRNLTARRWAGVVVAACLGLSSCGDNGSDSEPGAATDSLAGATPASTADETAGDDEADRVVRDVTLVLDWTPNTNHGGIYAAAAEGFYDDVGIELEIIQPGQGGSLQAVGTGNADFAIAVQESLIPARANGVPAVSIAAIIENNTSSLIALTSTGIETPADLEGHLYGGFGGQLEAELINRLVECDGGDPDQVEFVEVGDTDYRAGLESGAFDFVWIFDGWDKLRLELDGVDVTTIPFIDYQECLPNWYTPLIATSESLIAEDPELVANFMAATRRGYDLAITDPAQAADHLLAAAPELDEDLVRASAEYLAGQYAADPARWGYQEPAVWTEFTGFLTQAGLIDDGFDVESAYTNEFLEVGS